MMAVQIRKARRSATKLRLLLTGPSGSGKTYGGLLISKGLGAKRVIVIDTEQGSSDLYDRLLPFDVIDLQPPFTPEAYIEAIDAAEKAGADVIVIDSISHEWNGKGGCLELVDELARAKYRGNTWSAWSELTPRHRAFIDRMLRSSAHIIATGRSKTETAQVEEGGRKKVVKLGMKLESRDGAEYEFTTVLDLVHDGHFAVASKDRTGLFGGDPKPITASTGAAFAEWLSGAESAPAAVTEKVKPANDGIVAKAIVQIARATTRDDLEVIRSRVDARLQDGSISNDEAEAVLREVDQKESELIESEVG
jgi:hypothetical protein